MNKEEINEKILNTSTKLDTVAGFGNIAESLVDHIYELFGRNTLLNILYQCGVGSAERISKRLKTKYQQEKFTIDEAIKILFNELRDYYSIQIRDIEQNGNKIRFVIENRCFLRDSIKTREKLKFGKAFCRINKGYFETAFKNMLGDTLEKIDISYLHNDDEKDVCVEELVFYLK
ncbi:MAG: hypothetical protein ACTSR8_20045 [Promethearchaeota archaeon]